MEFWYLADLSIRGISRSPGRSYRLSPPGGGRGRSNQTRTYYRLCNWIRLASRTDGPVQIILREVMPGFHADEPQTGLEKTQSKTLGAIILSSASTTIGPPLVLDHLPVNVDTDTGVAVHRGSKSVRAGAKRLFALPNFCGIPFDHTGAGSAAPQSKSIAGSVRVVIKVPKVGTGGGLFEFEP